MFFRSCVLLAALASVSPVCLVAQSPVTPGRVQRISPQEWEQGYRQNLVLAKPRRDIAGHTLRAGEAVRGVRLRADLPLAGGIRLLELDASDTPLAAVARLRDSGLYEYVEPDYLKRRLAMPNDARWDEQWALRNTGQEGGLAGADISAVAAWDIRSTAPGVIVAILDTGIRATHEDLAANFWINPGEIPGNGIDDDGNGYVDDVHGINSLVPKGSAGSGNPNDDQGHGTAVAGVVGAVGNNGRGVSGVAWQVKLMSLKFDDQDRSSQGGTWVSNEIACIDYAIAQGAKVINISYGGFNYSQAEFEVLQRARDHGVILVASAGNEGASNEFVSSYPAAYLLDNIVAVANSDRRDSLDSSSTFGGLVELAAPGTAILTCSHEGDAAYRTVDGTSFSAPMVAGALALMKAQFPDDHPRVLINRMLQSVDRLPALSGKVGTGGRLNLARALSPGSSRPFNDDFARRSVLAGDSVLTRGSSSQATVEPGEPTHAVAGGRSLWWSWTAPRGGHAIADTKGSSFNTTLAIYTGSAVDQLVPVASNDDADGRTTSRVRFAITQGTTYHVAVDGKDGAHGFVVLAVAVQPPNDEINGAVTLTGLGAQAAGVNTNASRDASEPVPDPSVAGSGATVWYRWVAPRDGDFTVAVSTDSFDPLVAIYRGSSPAALVLEETAHDTASFAAVAGATYHFSVDSASPTTGAFAITLLEAYAAFPFYIPISSSSVVGPGNTFVTVDNAGFLLAWSDVHGSSYRRLKGSVDVATPTIGPDGTIYASTTRGLFAVTAGGEVRWEKLFDAGVSGSPTLAADGTIYVHVDDGWLYAFTPKGRQRWRARVPGASYASPSLGSDGTIYLGSDDGHVYALAPTDGSLKWRFDAGGEVYASVAVGNEDVLYVGTLGGRFHSISANGSPRWSYTAGGGISSSAAIGPDGSLYFGAYDRKLYALTSTGSLRWTYATGDEIRGSSPAVASDGTIYIGSYDGKVRAITASGALKQEYPTANLLRASPLLIDGEVIFGSWDGNVYFLYPATPPANSPWPMHRQNAARTGRRHVATAPVIHTQPRSRTVAIGAGTTLAVNAVGDDQLSFQWYLNGVPLEGATESSYEITGATAAAAGAYTVAVTNAHGTVTSTMAELKVVSASNVGRIINLSTRALTGTDSRTLIVGFVVGGAEGPKELLVRGSGPTLALPPYNVPGTMVDPQLTLYQDQTVIATNNDWNGEAGVVAAGARVGAFGFASPTSKDAALVTTVTPGRYSAHITAGSGATAGVALAEFYDAAEVYTAGSPRLINISARAQVGRGADILIVGFVITGDSPCRVLIRGIGPTLGTAPYNVAGVLVDPKLELRDRDQRLIETNDDWGTGSGELAGIMAKAGAFSLPANSKDAAMVVTLEPGLYSALISGVGDTTGVALAEVYQVE